MLCEDLQLLYWQLSPKVAMCDLNQAQLGLFVGSWFYHHHHCPKTQFPSTSLVREVPATAMANIGCHPTPAAQWGVVKNWT